MLPPMQKPRYGCMATFIEDSLFSLGGELTDASTPASCERFDFGTDEWELLPASRAPGCGAALALTGAAQGHAVIAIGGLGPSGQALGAAERASIAELLAG